MRLFKHNSAVIAAACTALVIMAASLRAQDGIVDVTPQAQAAALAAPAIKAKAAGIADVAFEGYYLGSAGQPLINTSGMTVNAKEFLPGIGLFHVAIAGYGGGGFHAGTNYVALEQAPLFGWHWDFVGGDSQFSSNAVANPFTNLYSPEISTRGVRVAMRRSDRSFQAFFGEETLLGGPRIPYRLKMPQQVLGGTYEQNLGRHWQIGLRLLHLSSSPSALAVNNTGYKFFIPGHEFAVSNNVTVQAAYQVTEHLKFFSEAGYGRASTFTPSNVPQSPLSLLTGGVWETDRYALRANYVLQSTTYMPLLGYFAGDRKGPFVEGRYRVSQKIDLYGSASNYSNNLENNPELPTFHSASATAGASFVLPWNFNANGSISTLHLTGKEPTSGDFFSNNRQTNLSVNRSLRGHSLRFSFVDMNLNNSLEPQTQRFEEFGDNFSWKHLVLGGAVRAQSSKSTETRNSLFFRGSVQANIKRLSVYANFEKGNDLANQTVFSTNAYNSTVIGASAPLSHGWNLQLETYRNSLNTALNPLNVFLFPTAGLAATQLPGFNQWSVFFRVGKQFRWGSGELALAGGIDQYVAARVPLVGSVQGLLMEESLAGRQPAANVAISLDHYRTAMTDATGHYKFNDVPEGAHEVGLNMDELPTDYEPGAVATGRVVVEPRSLVRVDFSVTRLASLAGQIISPGGIPIENIVLRLANTNRYTTPDSDGHFAFYNLREGDYTVYVDETTVSQDILLGSPNNLPATASYSNPAAALQFVFRIKPEAQKPVRQMLQEQIRVAGSKPPARNDDTGKAAGRTKSTSRTGANATGAASNKSSKSVSTPTASADPALTGAGRGGVGQKL